MENVEQNEALDKVNAEINEAIEETKNKNNEIELEITDEVEKPNVKEEEDKKEKKKIEDAKYSASVQKRIKKILADKNEAEERANNLQNELQSVSQRLAKIEQNNEKAGQNQLAEHYNLTKKALAKAIEEGDTEAQIKFNEELVDLKTSLALQRIEKQNKSQNVSPTVGKANYVQQNPAPALAQDWWQKNNWFNSKGFEQETAMARAIDVQLDIEGFDKNSPSYYQELNNRLQKRFPELISQDEVVSEQPKAKSRQTVAPTTGGSGYRGKRLTMSSQELAMARELGITDPDALKKYAKEIQTLKGRNS